MDLTSAIAGEGRGAELLCLCRLSPNVFARWGSHESESGRLSGSMTSDPKRGRARIVLLHRGA